MRLPDYPQPKEPLQASWGKAVIDYLRSLTPSAGPGLQCEWLYGGTTYRLAPRTPVGGGEGVPDHPFKVFTRTKPNVPSVTQGGVRYESSLYQSLQPNDKYSITGLLDAERESGWFDLIGNDAIWLGVTFDPDGNPDWAGIDSWGQGDDFQVNKSAWSGSNGYCEDDGGSPAKHQTSRKLIAYTEAGVDGKPVLTQVMFHDQLLRNVCIDGRPARYPFGHEGGYPL